MPNTKATPVKRRVRRKKTPRVEYELSFLQQAVNADVIDSIRNIVTDAGRQLDGTKDKFKTFKIITLANKHINDILYILLGEEDYVTFSQYLVCNVTPEEWMVILNTHIFPQLRRSVVV